jgi:hypothetical protein
MLPERLRGGLAELVDVAAGSVERGEQREGLGAHGLLDHWVVAQLGLAQVGVMGRPRPRPTANCIEQMSIVWRWLLHSVG